MSTDGRRARAERSRDAVVDAILELLHEGNRHPGAAEIAERAGVSLRSVFRHFDDLETLYGVAVQRHAELIAPLFELKMPVAPKGATVAPVARRLDVLVGQRTLLFEEMHPVRVVAERESDRSEALAAGMERSRRILEAQLKEIFAPEIELRSGRNRRDLLDSLEAAGSYRFWKNCREDQRLSVPRAAAAMRNTLHALLTSEPEKER